VSGYNADTTGQQTLTITLNGKTATFTVTVNTATLQSIAVTTAPAKTTYTVGQALDLTGIVVTGTYSNNITKTETVSASNVSGYNANTTGTQTLTVTVNGKTATFTVTVNAVGAPTLQSIAITTQPTKTTYIKGEALDLSGLVVTGTYSDGNTKPETVTTANVSGYDKNTVGGQELTVTVDGKTATFSVTVNPATLSSIAVTTLPTKTTYDKGEDLDLAGLVVTGTYSDNTTKPETVTTADVSGYDKNTVGGQELTVTVDGKTAPFTVTVNPAALRSIEITTLPTKTSYTVGEDLDLTGLAVTGTYSDNTTKPETVSADNISGYDADTLGEQTLIVTVSGKTAQFTVNVQTTAGFTVDFDAPINGIQEDIALSKTGSPASLVLEITGTYTSYEWRLNDADEPVSRNERYTLNASACRLGNNFLTVQVETSSGAYYSKEITINVSK
jgi:DNA-binding protein YbaB